ncbi:MAG: EI24 domain-containing protein [Bacteroidia bacterium]|nr:EI24 domain-containing protein [Bacteroidia bacterium]
MIKAFVTSATTYSEAFQAMSKYRLWKYAIIPGFLSMMVAGAVLAWALRYADDLASWIMSIYPFEWGQDLITSVLSWFSGAIMIVLGLFILRYLVMIVASPFMGSLSEKVEAAMTGQLAPSVSMGQMIRDVIRGLRIALRNIFREIFLTLIITIAGFVIPIFGNMVAAVCVLAVQAYYAGFGNIDYTLERKRFSVKDSVRFVGANKGMALGNGAGWLVLMLIPVLGWFLAPALGTVAATKNALEQLDQRTYSLF